MIRSIRCILRSNLLQPSSHYLPCSSYKHIRSLKTHEIPSQRPGSVDSVEDFFKAIGRNISAEASGKIKNWTDLFTLTSRQMKDAGIVEARTRRYILLWRDKYRKGEKLMQFRKPVKTDGGERRRHIVKSASKRS